MTIEEFDRAVPIHHVTAATCACGAPTQDADDHACGECAAHCTLEAHRREAAQHRATEQRHAEAQRIRALHASHAA